MTARKEESWPVDIRIFSIGTAQRLPRSVNDRLSCLEHPQKGSSRQSGIVAGCPKMVKRLETWQQGLEHGSDRASLGTVAIVAVTKSRIVAPRLLAKVSVGIL